jgi:diguanylate cyclase (GGDEF)-like protein
MNDAIRAKLEALKAAYAEKLPDRIAAILDEWAGLSDHFDQQRFRDFHRQIHSLAGSSGTYGYAALGQASRDLDIYLKQLLDHHHIDAIQKSEIAHLVGQMNDMQPTAQIEQSFDFCGRAINSKLVFYFSKTKGVFHQELGDHMRQLGYEVRFLHKVFPTPPLLHEMPACILVEDNVLEEPMLKKLSGFCSYQIPILCLAADDNLDVRLKAIHAGSSIFVRKPVELFHLANQLMRLCDLSAREDYRVLIIDDSVLLSSYYKLVLEEAGMNVRAIHSPIHLLHELQDFKPNLLLLDLYLPECTGLDLAKIIRQEECYMSLPIIFISAESDRTKQLSILNSCGADDFLTKPVLPQNLISAVKSRAQRAALLNSYIALDNLTKLLNHTYILKQLEFEILRAERFRQPIAVAMVDLDHFKEVNDQYGHPVGDLVLKRMSELFVTRVRKTDFVGRYGGEEFSIIFPNTKQKMAVSLCNELCRKASQHPFHINGIEFNVTLSIGIANYPLFHSADSLVAAADRALYRAKTNGRNRVEFISI